MTQYSAENKQAPSLTITDMHRQLGALSVGESERKQVPIDPLSLEALSGPSDFLTIEHLTAFRDEQVPEVTRRDMTNAYLNMLHGQNVRNSHRTHGRYARTVPHAGLNSLGIVLAQREAVGLPPMSTDIHAVPVQSRQGYLVQWAGLRPAEAPLAIELGSLMDFWQTARLNNQLLDDLRLQKAKPLFDAFTDHFVTQFA